MASELPNATQYKDLVAANASMKAILWSEKVLKGSSQRALFRDFTGEEDSGQPIIKKSDLTKGMAEEVTFTTLAPVRGQGILGENELKSNTKKLGFGTFKVTVDLLRQAVAFTQLLSLVRLKKKSPMQISSDLMTEWWARKRDDDQQTVLRNRALLVSPTQNLVRINGRGTQALLLSSDTITTTNIERSKASLISIGATAMQIDKGPGGADVPKYLFAAPDSFLRPLRSSATYLSSLQQAEKRGPENQLFSGKYAMWDGNVIMPHNIEIDSADGRQGSPLEPLAYLGTALADATPTTITGGGVTYAAGDSDYFAYFPGYAWKTFDSEVVPTDSATHYAMIYNLTDGKYEIFSYTAAGVSATGHRITGVTRGATTGLNGNVIAQAAGRFTNVHPSGSIILPCTINGVILGYALHMGAEALYDATGMIDAEPIFHWDDFKNAKDEAHLTGIGIQGVRGFSPYVDKLGRAKNFVLVEGAINFPGVSPEPFTG